MDWEECLAKRIARPAQSDLELIKSLRKTSENKLLSADLLELNETTAVSKLSLYYDSARELLEALAIDKGYKIYNHECYAGFLKEAVGNKNLAERFDRLRILRNSVNYYGQNISLIDTKESISELKILIKELKSLLR
ncbi:MAG: hypothetical protein AABX07_02310 [Nanoarchaeota archaeon]